MKKLILTLLSLFFYSYCFATPSNSISIPNSFTPNTTISSSQVNSNFNEISTKYSIHTHTDITQVGAITTGTWTASVIGTAYGGTGNAYGIGLPTGAVFFMITGSCPSGTTDVTATYADRFPRIHATPGTKVAATGHTHGAGTYTGPSHSHTIPNQAINGDGGTSSPAANNVVAHNHGGSTGADGDGAVTGTSASDDTALPAYFTCVMCQVD